MQASMQGVSWGDRKGRKRAIAALAVTAVTAMTGASLTATSHHVTGSVAQAAGRMVPVIIQATTGNAGAADAAIQAAGGHVTMPLGAAGSVAASVPFGAVASLRTSPAIAGVSVDQSGSLAGKKGGKDGGGAPASQVVTPTLLAEITDATELWGRGYTGQGIGVALLDSGVVPVAGLAGRIVDGPDLTPESQAPNLAHLDGYGHGTFMAGLIAGDGSATANGAPVGIAPGATIVNVKVANAIGQTQESSVIAGINWVIAHKDDPGLNIRVLNLSLSVPNPTGYETSPLAAAVERAWAAGIVVVAAAGNDGGFHLTLPAADPYVLAAGAADTNGTVTTRDDSVADFSDAGWSAASRYPDLVAPGAHLESLRDPGSYIDEQYGATAATSDGLFLGSGTSEATAVTSGAAALLLSGDPSLTPDQVKAMLVSHTAPLHGWPKFYAGHGELALHGVISSNVSTAVQDYPHALGWDDPATGEPAGSSWSGSSWSGSSWSGSSWSGSSWSGSSWSGSSWSGSSWSGSSWSGSSWSGSSWSGSSWSGSSWSSVGWN